METNGTSHKTANIPEKTYGLINNLIKYLDKQDEVYSRKGSVQNGSSK
ncbi:hypothetical protein AGMMS49975_10740 [Clostridia bacterium]|nr:hypothetical protein AGMMS49975_10740 [Clostridia bacterium]GHU75036.1 hypothetical protein FACS1894188_05000 [Clostridia bacterium]